MNQRDNSSAMNIAEDSTLQKFTIIQFVKRGRPGMRRELDIIPTDWIYYNKQRNRCTTQFPQDCTDPEDQLLLHDLVRNCGDPPEIWSVFTVEIRGRANTYEEALKKLTLLNDVESILTCSENDSTNLKDRMVDDIKRRKLYDEQNTLKKILSNANQPKEIVKVDATSEKVVERNVLTRIDQSSHNNTSMLKLETSMLPDDKELSPKTFDDLRTAQENEITKKSNEQSPLFLNQADNYNNLELFDSKEAAALSNLELPVIDIANVQCNSDFETAVITHLAEITKKLENISERQDKLTEFMLDKQISLKVRSTDFLRKYQFKLPIEEQEVFIKFDEQIKTNHFLERDVFTDLNTCIEKDMSISKSFLFMIRAFITKNVAVKYTASRKSTDKENPKAPFKLTNFYSCMQSVLLSARNKKNLPTDKKDLMMSLSNVLSNAASWDKKK